MNQILLTFLSLVAIAGCSSAPANEKADNDAKQETVAQATSQEPTAVAVDPGYINGVTDKNRGEKEGEVRIHGTIRGLAQGVPVKLYVTEGKNQFEIESTTFGADGFDFGVQKLKSGFYMLGVNDNVTNLMAFIVNGEEQDIELSFNSSRLDAQPTAVTSEENKGWFSYYMIQRQADNTVQQLRRQRSNSSFKERIDQQIKEQEKLKRDAAADHIKRYPDSFLAKFLTWNYAPQKSNMATYWDDIDFTDKSLVRMPVMNGRIQEFMRTFSGGKDAGFYNCVDILYGKSQVDTEVMEFSLYTMADGFFQSGLEHVSMYIIDSYIMGEDCPADISDVLKSRAQGLVNLQIGKVPPNFDIENWDGGRTVLYDEVKKHDYTLVMFWASWCHKCEQEIPVLKNVYAMYKDRGFGVINVSVDNTRNQWVNAIEENGMTWPNVSQLQMWDSPVAKDYRVTKTPMLFLLNKEGQIVDKPTRIFQVENFLKKNL
ncbi:TlpA family protein disulfide reductase [Sanyastnella coralliicola]|uniref:TlpA family protein disulfide reductase n=1 Tax=Sanyastnella coralliicola TaxID=3069118 RepID=UPI0027B950E2|nr:TlpA disulfide reductase family protein [Longitalea sp. SCSIO 12813]